MKANKPVLLLASLFLMSCGGGSSTTSSAPAATTSSQSTTSQATTSEASTTSSKTTTSEQTTTAQDTDSGDAYLDLLESTYGEFSINSTTTGSKIDYDAENNVYTLAVCADKAEYIINGFKITHLVIADTNNLGSGNYKGVKVTFNDAALVSDDNRPAISYELSKKNVQVSVKKGTNNVIYCPKLGDGVYSANNIEVSGKGNIDITTGEGHGMKADGNITVIAGGNINITSGHDGLHCKNLVTTDPDSGDVFSGTLTVVSAVSQGIDASNSSGNGTISLDGGKWNINNAESVFKTDTAITIGANATVVATGITDDAIAFGDNSVSDITLTVDGSFSFNGEALSSQVLVNPNK